MSYRVVTREDKRLDGYCVNFPSGMVTCYNHYICTACELADRIRSLNNQKSVGFLFCYRDCLRRTKAGGGECFYKMPIVLTEDAMDRLGIEKLLFNQVAVAYGGPGCFPRNVGGEIDIYLFSDPEKKFTISSFETYGIPNMLAVKKYEDLFFMGLDRFFKR